MEFFFSMSFWDSLIYAYSVPIESRQHLFFFFFTWKRFYWEAETRWQQKKKRRGGRTLGSIFLVYLSSLSPLLLP